jgi:hypothetical protein
LLVAEKLDLRPQLLQMTAALFLSLFMHGGLVLVLVYARFHCVLAALWA